MNSIVVHWSGACHGLVYSLVKSAKGISCNNFDCCHTNSAWHVPKSDVITCEIHVVTHDIDLTLMWSHVNLCDHLWKQPSSSLYHLCLIALDVERKPDVVLTTSSKILVSDVSVCKSFISLGTENNNIMTWDKLTGTVLK